MSVIGEMADMACASSDPFDEFERSGSGEGNNSNIGSYARNQQGMEWRNNRLKYDAEQEKKKMVYTAKTPGKKGTITDVLMNKNIGIDGKTYQLIDERVPMVQKMELPIGARVEYRIASQGDLTVKGKINFIGPDKDAIAAPKQPAPAQKAEPAPEKPAVREPRIIQGQYLSKTGLSITLKDGKGNAEAWAADLDLLKYLNKPDCKVKAGDMVKVRLLDNHGEWVAKDMGSFDPNIPETPFKTAQEILKENLDSKKAEQEKSDAALAQINKEAEVAKPTETLTDAEHYELLARGEEAKRVKEHEEKMAQISHDAKEYQEKMKAEIAAKKAPEAPKVPIMTQTTKTPEIGPQNAPMSLPDDVLPATGGVELAIHVNLGNYSSFDLKVTGINGEHARQLLQQESAPTIALAKSIIKQASSGY